MDEVRSLTDMTVDEVTSQLLVDWPQVKQTVFQVPAEINGQKVLVIGRFDVFGPLEQWPEGILDQVTYDKG